PAVPPAPAAHVEAWKCCPVCSGRFTCLEEAHLVHAGAPQPWGLNSKGEEAQVALPSNQGQRVPRQAPVQGESGRTLQGGGTADPLPLRLSSLPSPPSPSPCSLIPRCDQSPPASVALLGISWANPSHNLRHDCHTRGT
ncbi:hypothetical protein H1C71_039937, partial [Ictidomys tridecemlineatus]